MNITEKKIEEIILSLGQVRDITYNRITEEYEKDYPNKYIIHYQKGKIKAYSEAISELIALKYSIKYE